MRPDLRRRLPYLALTAIVVVADQVTKWIVARSLQLHEYHTLVPGILSLSHVRNRGAAFGLLSEASLPYQGWLFSLISVLALVVIGVFSLRTPEKHRLPQFALALVLGGALGNLVDRIGRGYVIDFIHVYWRRFQWWDFNLADSCITVGVTLLLLDSLLTSPPAAVDDRRAAHLIVPVNRSE